MLGGCEGSEPKPPPTPPSSTADGTACDFGAGSGPVEVGGPLQYDANGLTYGRTYIKPGTLQDAGVIQLLNSSKAPALITGVDLVPDPKSSALAYEGAFVRPSNGYLEFKPPRDRSDYQPAEGYCLQPTDDERPPVLVLRVGPSVNPGNTKYSQNNSVNVHYTTADGRRYVAAYPTRFRYPNRD